MADLDVVEAVGDDLPQGLVRVEAAAALVDVGDLDRVADLQLTAVGLLEADDGLEEGGLADTVGADDADDAVARQGEGQVVDEDAVSKPFFRFLTSMTTEPRRGPGGIWISSKSSLRVRSASAAISS